MSNTRTIAIWNNKGGVSKSTSSLNLGAALSRSGKRVLLVDMDIQANLTSSFGINTATLDNSIYDALRNVAAGKKININEYIIEFKLGKTQLHLLPSTIALSGFENDIKDHPQKEFLFKDILTMLNNFDFVIVDCPPSLGLITLNVLVAVSEVYVPVQTEFFSVQGLGQVSQFINAVSQTLNPDLKLAGVFGARFNNRKLHKDVLMYLKETFKDKCLNAVIRENVSLAESPSHFQDIFTYDPKSNGAKDYTALCKEILAVKQ